MSLKTILITLSCIAIVFCLITFYVVFYGGNGTYVVSSVSGPNAEIFATSAASGTASSATSSTLVLQPIPASSTAASSTQLGATPVTWTQGNETLSATGATISGSQLTLDVQVTMGSVGECVPLDLRMIADEQGDLSPPATSQFTFPDTGTCNGTPGETYSAQPVIFALPSPVAFPIILTTGSTANILFEVTQNSDGSLNVQLPPNSD